MGCYLLQMCISEWVTAIHLCGSARHCMAKGPCKACKETALPQRHCQQPGKGGSSLFFQRRFYLAFLSPHSLWACCSQYLPFLIISFFAEGLETAILPVHVKKYPHQIARRLDSFHSYRISSLMKPQPSCHCLDVGRLGDVGIVPI